MPRLTSEELLNAISQVESSNNPRAVGDKGKALGAFQMWPIAYKDVQSANKDFQSIPYERLKTDPQLQRNAARKYLELGEGRYGITDLDHLISFYNRGPAGRRGLITNADYVGKVKAKLGNPSMRKFHAKP